MIEGDAGEPLDAGEPCEASAPETLYFYFLPADRTTGFAPDVGPKIVWLSPVLDPRIATLEGRFHLTRTPSAEAVPFDASWISLCTNGSET